MDKASLFSCSWGGSVPAFADFYHTGGVRWSTRYTTLLSGNRWFLGAQGRSNEPGSFFHCFFPSGNGFSIFSLEKSKKPRQKRPGSSFLDFPSEKIEKAMENGKANGKTGIRPPEGGERFRRVPRPARR